MEDLGGNYRSPIATTFGNIVRSRSPGFAETFLISSLMGVSWSNELYLYDVDPAIKLTLPLIGSANAGEVFRNIIPVKSGHMYAMAAISDIDLAFDESGQINVECFHRARVMFTNIHDQKCEAVIDQTFNVTISTLES